MIKEHAQGYGLYSTRYREKEERGEDLVFGDMFAIKLSHHLCSLYNVGQGVLNLGYAKSFRGYAAYPSIRSICLFTYT